jgi:hypothetical protein
LGVSCSEACCLDGNKGEVSEFPDESSNLIFSFMSSRDPPLSPNTLDRHIKLMSQILNPFLGPDNRYKRVQISRVDPLYIKILTILR